jgi:hypothetical protein
MAGKTSTFKCQCCGTLFVARIADRNRGWAKFCSKSCKAIRQEARTHQNAAYRRYKERKNEEQFANAHLFSNEE